MSPAGTKAAWIGRGISVLPCIVIVFSAVTKLRGGPDLARRMAHLGLPESLLAPLAILELACVAVYLFPRTSVLGAVLLAGYLGGAILARVRVGDPWFFEALLGILLWLGLCLREPRLKALLPVRSS